MDEPNQPLFINVLLEGGPLQSFALLLALVCTGWLVISRVQGCFRVRQPNPVRDLAFLSTGPVCAMFLSLIYAASGAQLVTQHVRDWEFVLAWRLSAITAVSLVGFICFAAGIVAIMLPAKSNANVA